ncbi:MAG: O-antigen ligase family protein [Planctomycetota bacterium]
MHIFEDNLKRIESGTLMDSKRSFIKEKVCQLGILLSVLTGLAIPVSTSLTSLLSIGVLLCWFVSGQYFVTFELVKKYRVASASLIFFGFLALGLLYTPESLSVATRNLFKYRQFLLIPIYLSFFLDPKSRLRGIQMFEWAMIVTLIVSIIYAFIPTVDVDSDIFNRSVFKNRITQNILMAFLFYLAAWKFLEKPGRRWPYAILSLVAAYNIIAMVPGRSGYLALGVFICLLMYQKLGYKGIIPAIICVGGVGILAYNQSAIFHSRINQVITEIKEYRVSQNRQSGVNLRLEFYENSLHLAKSNPLIGSGTGSFSLKYHQLTQEKEQISTANPHNEYIMLLVQNGAIGVCLFLYFFWVGWRATQLMTGFDQAVGQAVLAVYFVGCFVNSMMLDTTEGNLFGFLVGLSLAGGISALEQKQKPTLLESSADNEEQSVVGSAA